MGFSYHYRMDVSGTLSLFSTINLYICRKDVFQDSKKEVNSSDRDLFFHLLSFLRGKKLRRILYRVRIVLSVHVGGTPDIRGHL